MNRKLTIDVLTELKLTFENMWLSIKALLWPAIIVNVLAPLSCSKFTPPTPATGSKKLTVGTVGNCHTLDPLVVQEPNCLSLSKLVHPVLSQTVLESNQTNVLPSLAESWIVESPSRLTIQLRQGLRWSNGATLQASHFLAKWKRLLSEPGKQPAASLLFGIKNARDYSRHHVSFNEVGLREKDPHTINIEFESPQNRFVEILSHPALSPEFPVTPPRSIPVLGKYYVHSHSLNDQMLLLPNSAYGGVSAPFSQIRILFFESMREATEHLNDGTLDVLLGTATPHSVRKEKKTWEKVFPSANSLHLFLNPRKAPLTRREYRHALLTAIHREEFLALHQWEHRTAEGAFRQNVKLDISGAQKIFRDNPIEPAFLPLTLTHSDSEDSRELAQNIQAQWRKNLGIPVELSSNNLEPTAAILTTKQLHQWDPSVFRPLWDRYLSKSFAQPLPFAAYESFLVPKERFDEWVISTEWLLLPLATIPKRAFLNPSIRGLSQDCFLLWNVQDLNPA